ncbi:MAG: pyridoxine/pyridoxal/pyridoxamine kinase [Burkholderiaceae bacterium]|nr:pyridoxine/pyridoxal/pyridoxamine kinase [Burkholderiaceae bacterium]
MTRQVPVATLQPLPLDVVSVQSLVVYGRVGNNVAVPTLEAFGLSVAAVPTVVLSNTPHYPTIPGGALPLDWFDGYLQDLSARGALRALRAILVGYLGNPDQAAVLARWVGVMLSERPDLRVVIDPVIGDDDHGIYVEAGMIEAYRGHLLAQAHGLTPNGFELAHLTKRAVGDVPGVVAAARCLLSGRTQWVAVTSAAPDSWSSGEMQVVLVTRTGAWLVRHPRVAVSPKGTGDLFSAALTAHWLDGAPVHVAAMKACDLVVAALRSTQRAQCLEMLLPFTARGRDPHRAPRCRAVSGATSLPLHHP